MSQIKKIIFFTKYNKLFSKKLSPSCNFFYK